LTSLPAEVLRHYSQVDEAGRLFQGAGELERVRTQDVLKRYLPKPPATVLDVGGGAGVHALWLAREGYQVHLIDAVEHHVEQALEGSRAQPEFPLESCAMGDARDLRQPDASADAVLLLGPLYHLTDPSDRVRALQEARRVLRPNGRIFVAAVCRFASLLDGLSRDLVADPAFVAIMKQDLKDGQHRNPGGDPQYFTTAFFHHPEDLKKEMADSGVQLEKIIGIEGPAWLMQSLPVHWNHPARRQLLLELLRTIEEDPCILGASAHLIGVARQ
jgi:ubiquinone/menaquinone biosynthesis C-methylase UbiE